MGLDNRELATLILLVAGTVAVAVLAVRSRSVRESLGAVATSFAHPKVLFPLLALGGCVVGLVVLARQVGLWEGGLTFSVIAWTATTGVGLLFKVAGRKRAEPFFRPTLKWALSVTVFVEVALAFVVFSLWVELILAIVLSVLLMFLAVAETKPELAQLKRFLGTVIGLLGFVIVGLTVARLISGWDTFDKTHALRELALPLWLTIGMTPYVYLLALWASYDSAFSRIDLASEDRAARRRAKLGLVLALHVRAGPANAFAWRSSHQITEAPTVREAYRVGRAFLVEVRQQLRAEREAANRLERYADVQGTDEDGRQLDQREFEETKSELLSLASAQIGWYEQDGRYRKDLAEFFPFTRLPEEHGVTVRVSPDGQRWLACRQTVTGWCFAVGAGTAPPDQWLYDGPRPPAGFPGDDPAWGEQFGIDMPNW